MPIYETVYCSNRQLAVAAAEFLNTKVFSTAQRRTGDVDMTPDNKQLINGSRLLSSCSSAIDNFRPADVLHRRRSA